MDKMYAIFEHELSIANNLPFRIVFENEPFRSYLFEEFCKAELIPRPWLYRQKFISNEEYNNAELTLEFRNKLDQIENEFYNKRINNSLESQFFCPDLTKTPTILTLREIEKALNGFKEPDSERDLYVEIVTGHLKAISKVDLRKKILEQLMDDDLNFAALLQEDNEANYKRWQRKKFEFNHLIKNNFSDEQDEVNLDNQDPLTELSNYITKSNQETITKIHGYCKDSLGEIDLIEFLKCVSMANFSRVIANGGTIKSKLKFTISVLNKVIKEPTWYQRASASIGSDPTGCSGANVPSEWKAEMIELANNKKK